MLKVEQFENYPYPSFEARSQAASLIYDSYLHPAGLLYVESVTPAVRKIISDILSRCIAERTKSINVCFNAAKLQVWDVLEQVFSHFIDEQGHIFSLLNKHFGKIPSMPC